MNGWRMGKPETVCGKGSMLKHTARVREWLPLVVKDYGINSVNDAGAGDLAWIKRVNWNVDYRPFDLIPRISEVIGIDITRDVMPPCDAILCRMVLNHLVDDDDDWERVEMALNLFKQSGRFLIATNFNGTNNDAKGFRRLNLNGFLGEPLETIQDGHDEDCVLSLWEI